MWRWIGKRWRTETLGKWQLRALTCQAADRVEERLGKALHLMQTELVAAEIQNEMYRQLDKRLTEEQAVQVAFLADTLARDLTCRH